MKHKHKKIPVKKILLALLVFTITINPTTAYLTTSKNTVFQTNNTNITLNSDQVFTEIALTNESIRFTDITYNTTPNIRENRYFEMNVTNILLVDSAKISVNGTQYPMTVTMTNQNTYTGVLRFDFCGLPPGTYDVSEVSVTDASGTKTFEFVGNITHTIPELETYTPANNTTINSTFPPLLDDITFTWAQQCSSYQFVLAQDNLFNLVVADEHVAFGQNYTTVSLLEGNYYWRVRTYNSSSGEYGNWTNTSQFTLNKTAVGSDGSTGIHGCVYTGTDTKTVISGAYVTIWNDTWTSGMITGSNGYFLFTGLDNTSTYSLQAVKDGYEESVVELVTPALGEWVVKNIYLQPCTSSLECFYNSHFVRLTYYDSYWSANPVQGLTVKVYEGTSADVKYQSTTDHTGSVVFLLVKNQEYTITFTGDGVSDSYTITPSEDNYQFYGSGEVGEWDEDEHDIIEDINISVWTSTINATHAKIYIHYDDSIDETASVTVYLNQTNTSDYRNQTMLDSYTSDQSNFTWTPTVSDYRGKSYHIRLDVNHGEFGEFMRDYGVRFKGMLVDLGWSEPVYLLFAIGLMLFVGAIFTATSVGVGSMVVVMLGWIFYFIGWLNYIPSSKMLIGLIFATVVALAANMAIKTQREGIG